MTATYRIGVVGVGSGGRLSIRGAAESPRYELVAVTDMRAEVRAAIEQEYPGVQTFADHKAMLAACDLDVVCKAAQKSCDFWAICCYLRSSLRSVAGGGS